ncbi:MAG: hypothetical protein QM813_06045 [Verrucomicrobiota bacterium]
MLCLPTLLFWTLAPLPTAPWPIGIWASHFLLFSTITLSLFTIVFYLAVRTRCIYVKLAFVLNLSHLVVGSLVLIAVAGHK